MRPTFPIVQNSPGFITPATVSIVRNPPPLHPRATLPVRVTVALRKPPYKNRQPGSIVALKVADVGRTEKSLLMTRFCPRPGVVRRSSTFGSAPGDVSPPE